jgi:hypothetical protein
LRDDQVKSPEQSGLFHALKRLEGLYEQGRKGREKVSEKKMTDEEKKEVLRDLDSDGTAVEVAEAMIAIDPSKATKKAADKLLKEVDESSD